MADPAGPPWALVGFKDRYDTWLAQDPVPDAFVRLVVETWILSRSTDPYQGAQRLPEFGPNFWGGRIAGTEQGDHVVVGYYWINETNNTVRCDSIATLSLPL
jgi:hypothetical protein